MSIVKVFVLGSKVAFLSALITPSLAPSVIISLTSPFITPLSTNASKSLFIFLWAAVTFASYLFINFLASINSSGVATFPSLYLPVRTTSLAFSASGNWLPMFNLSKPSLNILT